MGVIAYTRIPKDLLPLFRIPAVQVLTLYPGMPTEVVEKDITTRLERWTGQSIGIYKQESRSMLGVSIVRDYFRSDVDISSALSQVTSLAMSDLYYLPPGTIPPMVMPFDPTATVPLALITVSSESMSEKDLYDIAYFDLRNRLQGISGVIASAVYGGKLRRIIARVSPKKLAAYNLSSLDVVKSLNNFNTLIPAGDIKFGDMDYQIVSNSLVNDVKQMDGFPIRSSLDGKEVLISDIGFTEDTSEIQSNVRVNGKRQVYIPIYRQPGANTIAVIDEIRNSIEEILTRLPKGINIDLVADQSAFVRQAIHSVVMEMVQGALLSSEVSELRFPRRSRFRWRSWRPSPVSHWQAIP
ncbi:MAG: efflux RND transporter permease subunit [Methylocella sp.]